MEVVMEPTDELKDKASLAASSAETQLTTTMSHSLSPYTVFPGATSLPPEDRLTDLTPSIMGHQHLSSLI